MQIFIQIHFPSEFPFPQQFMFILCFTVITTAVAPFISEIRLDQFQSDIRSMSAKLAWVEINTSTCMPSSFEKEKTAADDHFRKASDNDHQ